MCPFFNKSVHLEKLIFSSLKTENSKVGGVTDRLTDGRTDRQRDKWTE